jgi:hypothetical protein
MGRGIWRNVMVLMKWPFMSSAVAFGCAASIVGATVAIADPVSPVAGDSSAADTIRDLEDQGYSVAINWVSGYSTEPLSTCRVLGIHNPDRSPDAVPMKSTTVYVDVSCPNNDDLGGSFGFGVGF